jgi:hypothetical protein
MTYKFTGDYKVQFSAEVTKLIEKNNACGFADRADKMAEVQRLTDAYIDQTGETPEASELERLTDAILSEELKSEDLHKRNNTEYPFMSERQMARRKAHEAPEVESPHNKPVSGRRKRTKYENNHMDKGVRTRNAERKRQYRKDTAPGPVITYTLPPEDINAYLKETYGYRNI